MKKILYSDQFFTGAPGEAIYFAANLVELEGFGVNGRELTLALGSPDDGFSLYWDMFSEEDRENAVRTIRRFAESFRNLLSIVEKENDK